MKKILAKVLVLLGLVSFFPVASVFADNQGFQACQAGADAGYTAEELKQMGCEGGSDTNPGSAAVNVINVFISIMGVLAVIMIIIGGIWYIVSQGDPTRTKRGRDTVIFASLGLVVVLLAYAVVNFVGSALGK